MGSVPLGQIEFVDQVHQVGHHVPLDEGERRLHGASALLDLRKIHEGPLLAADRERRDVPEPVAIIVFRRERDRGERRIDFEESHILRKDLLGGLRVAIGVGASAHHGLHLADYLDAVRLDLFVIRLLPAHRPSEMNRRARGYRLRSPTAMMA
jgi:hypothetical protein